MKYFTLIILFTTLISCTSESPAKKDTGEIKKGETVESEISTKRSAPREVKAIIHDGMEYHVALNELIVIDSASRDTAWRKIVYDIVYDLDLEKDIQDEIKEEVEVKEIKLDDKDRVLIKSDKTYTYLAPDIAYHQEKFKRATKLNISTHSIPPFL